MYELFVGVEDDDFPFVIDYDEMKKAADEGKLAPKPLPGGCPEIPRKIAAVCLQREPAARPTAVELLEMIEAWRIELHKSGQGQDDALPLSSISQPLLPLGAA